MPGWNDGLTGEHLNIAAHDGPPMRVVAGPGTGKSFGLKRKVKRLIESGIEAETILAVTFTNVAADALKKDLQQDLIAEGIEGAEKIRACTLHSLCFSILQQKRVIRIIGRAPRPLMEYEKDLLVEDLKDGYGGKDAVKKLISDYESAFAREQTDTPGLISTTIDHQFSEDLMDWLKFHDAMLIGEVVPMTVNYLKSHPEAEERSAFKHILVDEYQDLNKVEQVLIGLLKSETTEIVIVGDEDQSIYGFKNAHPEGIADFSNSFPDVQDVNLTVCRRCPKKIVRLANEFMGYNHSRTHKKMGEYEENGEGEIDVVRWKNIYEEQRGISAFIKKLISEKDVKPKDILVLAPRTLLGHQLKKRLVKKHQINARTFFKEDPLHDDEAKRRFALLQLSVDPEDKASLRVLLGLPTALSATYKKIVTAAKQHSKSVKEILEMLDKGEILIPRSNTLLTRYSEIKTILQQVSSYDIQQWINWLSEDVDGIESLKEICAQLNISEIEDVETLLKKLRRLVLFPETAEEDPVRIMSLHKSKGLSAKYVIILGCCEGLIPSIKDAETLRSENQLETLEKLLEEAKRVFFVGMTRTKEHLIFSSFHTIDQRRAKPIGGLKLLNERYSRQIHAVLYDTQASQFFDLMRGNLPDAISGEQFIIKHNLLDILSAL